jgi:tripartite ATP-independent transporter DctM subunit
MASEVLIAVPLFVFMGCMLDQSGATQRLYDSARVLMGPLKGGLAILTVLIATLFAACTGIVGASIVTMGLISLSPMVKCGYNKPLATGVICAGGTLGILIPPSIMLILYGPTAGLSVARLFAAAVMPGLLLAALYIMYIAIRCFLNPRLGPPVPREERDIPLTKILQQIVVSLIPPIFLIAAVLGSIMFGIVAPTEAAAMGAVGSLLITVSYRQLNWQTVKIAARRTLEITVMVMWVVIGASVFTGVFLGLGGGEVLKELILGFPGGPTAVLIAIMAMVFVLGMFIDWIGILLIVVPIVTPIAAELGFDPIWFALTICVNLQMSYLTPPFAYAIFYLKGIAPPEVTLGHIYRGVVPFIALQMIGLALVIMFPQIVLWVPHMIYGY